MASKSAKKSNVKAAKKPTGNAATKSTKKSAAKKSAKPTVGSVVDEVLKRRTAALRARVAVVDEMTASAAAVPPFAAGKMPALLGAKTTKTTEHVALTAAAKAVTKGWLVAEGDSWFDYPGVDVLNALERSAWDVASVAHAGDRVEMMAFGRGQLEKFAAAVEKVIANGHVPKAILLSGGGNDIAGEEFGFLLNHAGSPKQGLNQSIVQGVIDERARDSYDWIIRTITDLCQKMLGQKVRIVVHGYGYPIPNGDGVLGGWGPLPGPWLRPGFIEKGFNDLTQNTATIAALIDRFNVMLANVAATFNHVRYVDLRPLLPATKSLWANELHPKEQGFQLAAQAFEQAITAP